jgi:hypothetical protein
MEQLEYNLLLGWLVGLSMGDAAWDAAVLCKNPDRLLDGDVARKFMTLSASSSVTEALPCRHILVG